MKNLIMFLVMLVASLAYADPILHLTLNGNLDDTGTAGITGITKGASATWSTNVPPNGATESYSSNSTSDTDQSSVVTIPTSTALTPASGSFTMTFWLHADSVGWAGNGMCIYDKEDLGTNSGIIVSTSNLGSSARLFVQVNNYNLFTTASGISYVGKWVFAAVTYDGVKTVTTYQGLEGSYTGLLGSTDMGVTTGAVKSNTIDAILGYRQSYGGRALDGQLSDFRLYDGVLEATAIEAIYNQMIPEPVTMGILLVGGFGFIARKRR